MQDGDQDGKLWGRAYMERIKHAYGYMPDENHDPKSEYGKVRKRCRNCTTKMPTTKNALKRSDNMKCEKSTSKMKTKMAIVKVHCCGNALCCRTALTAVSLHCCVSTPRTR